VSCTAEVHVHFRDPEALAAACRELNLSLTHGSVTFHDGAMHTGAVIQLPAWRYPIVVGDAERVFMDTYEGRWGDMAQFDRLKQAYAVEASIRSLARKGLRVVSRVHQDGHVHLVLQ
jgi:hypothetical protein